MSAILLKSYIGEIFLSFSILLQLIINIRVINSKKYNFPEITAETFYQSFFILFLCTILVLKSNIEGSFFGSFLVNDQSSKNLKIIFLLLTLFVWPLLYKSFKFQKLNFFEYCNLLLLSILSLLLMINSNNLLSFYILMEMQALCFYVLASFQRNSVFSTEAGIKYFVAGSFISGFYLLGVSLIYGSLGTLDLSEINILLNISLAGYNSLFFMTVVTGLLLILGTLLFKIACFPFHFWAPDVYEGSPITSTVVFSIFPKISLFSFFIKIIGSFVLSNISEMDIVLRLLLICGILSTLYGTFLALTQTRFKRLVIYSSIGQTGFLVSGISIGTLSGFADTYFFLVVYLITSVLIWGYFINFYEGYSSSAKFFKFSTKPLHIVSLENLDKFNPIFTLPLIIIFFSIAGIPPLSGFLVKLLILYDLVKENLIFPASILVIISAVSVYYYIRVLKIAYFEPKKNMTSSFYFFQEFSTISDTFFLIMTLFVLTLFYLFFFPTGVLLFCQHIVSL